MATQGEDIRWRLAGQDVYPGTRFEITVRVGIREKGSHSKVRLHPGTKGTVVSLHHGRIGVKFDTYPRVLYFSGLKARLI